MSARVAVVVGGRSLAAAGLEHAERRLLSTLVDGKPSGLSIELRVVGRRMARGYARHLGARWVPAAPGSMPRRAWRRADLVHLPGTDLRPPPTDFVATIHDLAALEYPDEGTLTPWMDEIVQRAVLITCPSQFTATEVERQFRVARERIRVVPNGPGCEISPTTAPLGDAERRALGLPSRFVLRLGGYTQRKNVGRLLEAWQLVEGGDDLHLVLAGPFQPARERLGAVASSLERVHILDYVEPELLPRLIRSAEALVTTSLYEGFGLTPLEAMAAGTPVVAVRMPAAEEVCGEAAVLVPDEPALLAAAIGQVATDATLRERLRVAGLVRSGAFTWSRAAELLVEVYRDSLEAGG